MILDGLRLTQSQHLRQLGLHLCVGGIGDGQYIGIELFPSEEEAADRWFKCKLIFITLDEKSGAEKKTSTQVLVQAADLRDAVKKLDEGMKGTMADYQIGSVAETAIMDVYPYSSEPNDKPEV